MFNIEEYFTKHTINATIYNDNWNRKLFTKVIKMPSWKAWSMRPSGLIKQGRKPSAFRKKYFDWGRVCFVGTNIHNQSKSLSDR
jgi:hypothetical protein